MGTQYYCNVRRQQFLYTLKTINSSKPLSEIAFNWYSIDVIFFFFIKNHSIHILLNWLIDLKYTQDSINFKNYKYNLIRFVCAVHAKQCRHLLE